MFRRDAVLGATRTETGMYSEYMRISSTLQQRNVPVWTLNQRFPSYHFCGASVTEMPVLVTLKSLGTQFVP